MFTSVHFVNICDVMFFVFSLIYCSFCIIMCVWTVVKMYFNLYVRVPRRTLQRSVGRPQEHLDHTDQLHARFQPSLVLCVVQLILTRSLNRHKATVLFQFIITK